MIEHNRKVRELKVRLLDVAYKNQMGFLPSAYSIMDILVCLYYRVMNPVEDRFILSKGHAAMGLYAVLEDIGVLDREELDSYGRCGSRLPLMADGSRTPSVLFSTGSLGQGLSEAAGYAYAMKARGMKGTVYAIIGDGELNEGSVWETFFVMAKLGLDNMVCIVDDNGTTDLWEKARIDVGSLLEKVCTVKKVDGHDGEELCRILNESRSAPCIVIADTIKGKGCSDMEKNPGLWHAKAPDDTEYKKMKEELV